MNISLINSRADIDALSEADRAEYMTLLQGSMWRFERDDENQRWNVVQDTTTIERFGFTAADFPADVPDAPVYEAVAPSVPSQVSPAQIRIALNQMGLRAQVEAAVEAGSQDLKDWWEYSTEIQRNHPLVVQMATGLGVSVEQTDALFMLASTL
jgi:hypothetical protein